MVLFVILVSLMGTFMHHGMEKHDTGEMGARRHGDMKSIVENTADGIQKIFTACLADRSSTRYNKPEGKKTGLYICANLVLKLLFTVSSSWSLRQVDQG